jgi:uncharacterized protein
MGKIREQLELLTLLQEKDVIIDKLKDIETVFPVQIEELKNLAAQRKSQITGRKSVISGIQLKRKEKEIDLETKENEIKKHNIELNSVKSNDAYKALLTEIEDCRKQKGDIENDILEIMEKMESESVLLKAEEQQIKEFEATTQSDIAKLERDLEKAKAEREKLVLDRNEFASKISKDFLSQYEYVRESKDGIGISNIEGETCTACHITLRPQIINDVCKEQEIVMCDTCSRILFKRNQDS